MNLAFDRQEYDARLARVREQMAGQNLDVVLVFGQDQMFYLTGYDQIGYSCGLSQSFTNFSAIVCENTEISQVTA